jgi:hypothetical protein
MKEKKIEWGEGPALKDLGSANISEGRPGQGQCQYGVSATGHCEFGGSANGKCDLGGDVRH